MSKIISITSLNDEIEAQIISKYLDKNNIPYFIKKTEEFAYDGLWKLQLGWGHILAPEEYKEKIIKLINELKNSDIMDDRI